MNCTICNSKLKDIFKLKNIPFSVFWDYDKKKLNFEISICENCGFIVQSSAYSNFEFDKISNSAYIDYDMTHTSFPNLDLLKKKSLKFLEDNLNLEELNSALEVGSGRGDFLYLLKEKNPHLNILGCEPSTKESFIPTINAFFTEKLFSNKFDILIARFVLEHIKYPHKFLKTLKSVISDSGYLYIEVPNVDFYIKNYINEFCPEHINYFSKISIENLLINLEFELIKIDTSLDTIYLIAKKIINNNIKTIQKENSKSNILKNYFESKEIIVKKIVNYIKSGKKIIFYGSGNMFIWNYYTLNIMLKKLDLNLKDFVYLVIDDNKNPPKFTKSFNIKIINREEFKSEDNSQYIVIISIANLELAKKLYSNIKDDSFTDIIIPWSLNNV